MFVSFDWTQRSSRQVTSETPRLLSSRMGFTTKGGIIFSANASTSSSKLAFPPCRRDRDEIHIRPSQAAAPSLVLVCSVFHDVMCFRVL